MFQEDFAKYGLVTLIASAANLRYPNLTPKNENLLISLWYLQSDFYKQSNWANASEIYKPYSTVPTNLTFITMMTEVQKTTKHYINHSHRL